MSSYNTVISGFVVGDDVIIIRTVENIPSGQVLNKSWFTVKTRYTDDDAHAIYQKIISASVDAIQGQITNIGASGTSSLSFLLNASDTILMRPDAEYFYDIQIKTSADKIRTHERGVIVALAGVTSALS